MVNMYTVIRIVLSTRSTWI